MNCEAARKHLLGSERPDRPSAEASAHIAACLACLEWQQRLVQLELAVRQLPTPRADAARSALLRRILTDKPASKPKSSPRIAVNGQAARRPSIARVVGSWIMDPHASPRRRVAAGLVAGVAAALLLFLTGWLVWDATRPGSPMVVSTPKAPPRDPVVVALEKLNIRVSENGPPAQRIREFSGAADELRTRAGARAATDSELSAMALLYSQVVRDGVIKTAQGIAADGFPGDERDALLRIADQLGKDDSEWKRLSQQTGLSEGAKNAVNRAALAASDAKTQLLELCGRS
jgi:hypothetical protein